EAELHLRRAPSRQLSVPAAQDPLGRRERKRDGENDARRSTQGGAGERPADRPGSRDQHDTGDRDAGAHVARHPGRRPRVVAGQQHVPFEPRPVHRARREEQHSAACATDGGRNPAQVTPSLPCASVDRMDEVVGPSALDRALRPLHRWVWRDPHRRARKLLRFAETEADGGRDLSRAAELTADPLLRRLYLRHAEDELRHAALFRERGGALLRGLPRAPAGFEANWLTAGGGWRARLFRARAGRLWRAYLRVAAALASVVGTLLLRIQYFVVLPPFALLARRAAKREPAGFMAARRPSPLTSQY